MCLEESRLGQGLHFVRVEVKWGGVWWGRRVARGVKERSGERVRNTERGIDKLYHPTSFKLVIYGRICWT